MSDNTRKSVSYALNFLSFIFLEKGIEDKISSAYLFGSAVRGELDEDSDIDIFINCKNQDVEFVLKAAEIARKKFIASKDYDKWKVFNFTYPLSIKAGQLAEWELRASIESEGIEIYSKSVQKQRTEKIILFSFDLPDSKKHYLKIRRALFGRVDKNYQSKGLVEIAGGRQLGSNLFIVPKSKQNDFIKILHTNKIKSSMMEMQVSAI